MNKNQLTELVEWLIILGFCFLTLGAVRYAIITKCPDVAIYQYCPKELR